MIGRVVSTKLENTATVLVERRAVHPLYKKSFVRSKKFLVDDRIGVKDGDIVEFIKCKPVSKNKHWTVLKVIGKNLEEINEAQLKAKAQEVIAEVMPKPSVSASQSVSESQDQKKSEEKTVDTAKTSKQKKVKVVKKEKVGK